MRSQTSSNSRPHRLAERLPRAVPEEPPGRRSSGRRQSTRERARVLLREYHEHGDLAARERLIQQYMPLVKSLARRHSAGGELYEDLVQVGCIGLIKAVDRFDSRRAEFGAFVIPNVAGEIKRYLRDRGLSGAGTAAAAGAPAGAPRVLGRAVRAVRAPGDDLRDRRPLRDRGAGSRSRPRRGACPDTALPLRRGPQGRRGVLRPRRARGRLRARRAAGAARRRIPRARRPRAPLAPPAVLRRAEPAADRRRRSVSRRSMSRA